MKRISCLLFVVVLMCSIYCPTFALYEVDIVDCDDVYEIAYLDLTDLNAAEKAAVLKAREEIIYSESWVVEGCAYIVDEDGNTVYEVPHFYDLFPSDWEVPYAKRETAVRQSGLSYMNPLTPRYSDINTLFDASVMLYVPSNSANSLPFCTVNTYNTYATGTSVLYSKMTIRGHYSNQYPYGTFNCGLTNANTGRSLGYAKNIPNGYNYEYIPAVRIPVDIRASTYSTECVGGWRMTVTGLIN